MWLHEFSRKNIFVLVKTIWNMFLIIESFSTLINLHTKLPAFHIHHMLLASNEINVVETFYYLDIAEAAIQKYNVTR